MSLPSSRAAARLPSPASARGIGPPVSSPSRKARPAGTVATPSVAGERSFLARLQSAAARASARSRCVRLGIGDDCAILRPPLGHEVVVTTDLFLEKVHFRRDWHSPESAGHRCLARGLSDIAAMGARPEAAFLSFALPPELVGPWADRFLKALLRLAASHGVVLAGGDTAQAPAPGAHAPALFSADIVLLGTVARDRALLRSGARPGDRLYVTGALGGAAAELASLTQQPDRYARMVKAPQPDSTSHPHLFPQPRNAAGLLLSRRASAAIDLSDGLSTDLAHLCAQSGVAARVEASLLPIHPLARKAARAGSNALSDALAMALHGGEDYELLFTAPPIRRMPATLGGVPIHRIGAIVKARKGQPAITLVEPNGTEAELMNAGWEHFRSTEP